MKFGVFLAATDLGQGKSHKELLDDVIELAVEAEQLGFDYVWLPEHDLIRFIINTSALQEAVLIAQRTSRIKIGASIFVTPLYHPLLLAADVLEADNHTRGRFEVGLGRGGSKYELRQLQAHLSEEDSRTRFKEFYEVFGSALASNDPISYHGEFFDFDNAFVMPRPYSDPFPAPWLAGITPDSVRANAALGANVQFTPFRKPFGAVIEAANAFKEGRGSQSNQFMVSRQTYVADTMEEARKVIPLIDYHEHVIGAARVDGESVHRGVREWKEGLQLGLTDDEYLENLVIGDPETVAEKVAGYAELGIDQYCMYTTLGQDVTLVRRSMQLFAERVMPRFREWPTTRVSVERDARAGRR
jgi:flavin-dependent trigonelline monooxygenase, oxygenase component